MGTYLEEASSDLKINNLQLFRPEPIRFNNFPPCTSNFNSTSHDPNDLILSNFQNPSNANLDPSGWKPVFKLKVLDVISNASPGLPNSGSYFKYQPGRFNQDHQIYSDYAISSFYSTPNFDNTPTNGPIPSSPYLPNVGIHFSSEPSTNYDNSNFKLKLFQHFGGAKNELTKCGTNPPVAAPTIGALSDGLDSSNMSVVGHQQIKTEDRSMVGGKKPKKSRVLFSQWQINELEKLFKKQKYVTSNERELMAKRLKLQANQVFRFLFQ